MSAQRRPGNGLGQPSGNPHQLAVAPPPTTTYPLLRRDNVAQPPALTTSLSGVQFQSGLSADYSATPASAAWEFNPFTNSASPYTASPGGAIRGTSPMDGRLAGGYNTQYNPQDWGPVGGRSSPHHVGGQQRRGPPARIQTDEPTELPPPPYSPREQQHNPPPPTSVVSPAETASAGTVPSVYNTPISAATTISLEGPASARSYRPRPLSTHPALEPQTVSPKSSFPPPPAGGQNHRGSRSTSRGGSERIQALWQSASLANRSKLSNITIQDAASESTGDEPDTALRPPAAKRAASAGVIGTSEHSSRASSHGGSRSPSIQGRWEPGMPLPPPPPVPPPSSSRSQSSNGIGDGYTKNTLAGASVGKRRQPPVLGTSLDPVPPTPAWWSENENGREAGQSSGRQNILHIDTTNVPRLAQMGSRGLHDSTDTSSSSANQSTVSQRRQSSGLFRTPAIRDSSVKAIRERRSESRNAREKSTNQLVSGSLGETEGLVPADLSLPSSGTGLSSRKPTNATTPYSGGFVGISDDPLPTGASKKSSGLRSNDESSAHSTPRPESARMPKPYRYASPTPPISAAEEAQSPTLSKDFSTRVPSKALPTPPLQSSRPPSSQSVLAFPSGIDRPVSHLLHLPNDSTVAPPLSPQKQGPTDLKRNTEVSHGDDEEFVRDATERYRKLLASERAAGNDADRLRLFANFMITESSIRRGRYAEAWDFGAVDLERMRDRIFEKPPQPRPPPQHDPAPPIEPPSPLSPIEYPGSRPETAWWDNYKPCLSPIASMSHNDEMSSRGRTPSRWWESQTGSGSHGRGSKIERSKRESKYMGVPIREARDSLKSSYDLPNLGAFVEETRPSPLHQQPLYGPDEYPLEKQGWHETEEDSSFMAEYAHPRQSPPASTTRSNYDPRLDISLFITLPPPYPRHHPAISNSHPDLAKYRSHVRAISDMSEVSARSARYNANMDTLRRSAVTKLEDEKKVFLANVRAQIDDGSISFAEAAEAEEAFKDEEAAAEKKRVQSEFDEFQDVVLRPLRELLSPRIQKTDGIITELIETLHDNDRMSNPDQTQEEGDEQPELQEMLTQLKWLFESRENLYRELYTLEGQQNKLYEQVVTQPYISQGASEAKLQNTRSFFQRDECERKVAFEQEALKRYQDLERAVEEHVDRGVEVQLSAFWDIAPGLLELLGKLPTEGQYAAHSTAGNGKFTVDKFHGIQIPVKEVEENPSYGEFPEQYLWSLLTHAERSTYQYIESQVNLLCLQHEVRCSSLAARSKTEEAANALRNVGSTGDEIIRRKRVEEEKTLTDELQERVATVENLWRESLGSQLGKVKEGVRRWLLEKGGWEEELDD